MHLPKDWGHQFSALLCNLHVHNISTHRPFFKMNIQILRHFGKKLLDSRHFKLDTSHVIRHFELLDPPILVLFLLQFDCPYGSLARSVPKPLKVPSLARFVPKPLKLRSLAR